MKVTVKKVVSILLVAVMLFGAAPLNGFVDLEIFGIRASAVEVTDTTISGTIGTKLSWEIDKTTKVLTIDNDGAMVSFASDDAPWRSYKEYFDTVVVNEGCTNISQNAFYNCYNIVAVELPDSIETIGDNAFYCCTSLNNISIPENVTSLGSSSFYNCTTLESIIVPENVSKLGDSVFSNCSSLASVRFLSDYKISIIPSYAFYYCENLSEINIPESIKSIGSYAFCCASLGDKDIIFENVTISSYAFYGCKKINLANLINCSIGYQAFYNSEVVSVNIDNCIFQKQASYYYETYTFRNCLRLKNISISDTDLHGYVFRDCKNIEAVKFKGNCQIGYEAFYNIDTLSSVSFECSNLTIDSVAFYDCDALQSVSINCNSTDGYSYVSNQAFYGCDTLESAIISVGIDSIDSEAFANCPMLEKVTIYNKDCSIAETAISIYSTIYGFIGSTAEEFANIYGYNFVSIDTPCEHIYSNDCDTSCNICGVIRETGAHDYSDWTVIKEASCNKTGLRERVCSICGDVDEEIIEMLPHTDEDEDGICEVCEKQFEIKYPMHGICGDNLTWALDDEGVLTIEGTGEMYDFNESNYVNIYIGGSGSNESTTAIDLDDPRETTTFRYETTTREYATTRENATTGYYIPSTEVVSPSITHPNDNYTYVGTTKKPTTTRHTETTTVRDEEPTTVPSTTRPESTTVPSTSKSSARAVMYAMNYTSPDTFWTTSSEAQYPEDGYIKIIRWNLHFDKIKKVIIGEGVTSIGDYAFANCPQVTDVEIPDSVERIGYRAFINCTGLKEIEIPKNVIIIESFAFNNCSLLETLNLNAENLGGGDAFYNTSIKSLNVGPNVSYIPRLYSLETVVFSEGATSVPNYAFSGCDELISVTLSGTVTSIGYQAFYNCYKLKSINIPNSVTYIGNYAFQNCESITTFTTPSSICDIGYRAFYNCINLNTVNYNTYSGSINYSSFENCPVKTLNVGTGVSSIPKFYSVETVTFSEGATSVPSSAFSECMNLTEVNLPDTVTNIGSSAFFYCTALEKITIPENVRSIGYNAFYNCSKLASVIFNAKDCSLSSDAFYMCPIKVLNVGTGVNSLPNFRTLETVTFENGATKVPDNSFSSCTDLSSVTLPDSIETIGYRAFDFCSSLESIKLPKNLKTIGDRAFYACYNLKTADLPGSVKRIEKMAFDNCTSLEEIILPDTVEYIGQYAFYGCTSVPSIIIPENVSQIGYAAFGSCYALESVEFNATECDVNSRDIFYGCNKISSVKIGSKVTVIPERFMNQKTNVTSVVIPSSVKEIGASAFRGTSLTVIDIPNGVELIGADAFGNINTAKEINIPETVISIAPHAFANMLSVENLNFNAINANVNNESYWYYSEIFANTGTDGKGITVVFGNKVETIPAFLFEVGSETAYPNIKNVIIGSSVKEIGDNAFYHCCSIENVEFGGKVETIGERAFDSCINVKELNLPESLKNISNGAFYSCNGLTEITIPENVEFIGVNAFRRCSSLEKINYNATNCIVDYNNSQYAFDNCKIVKTVNIGNTVKVLPPYAFTGCSNLEKAYIPDIVINIDPLAFDGCGNVAIVCKNGSYANVYAVQNGIKYVLEDNVTGTAFEIRNSMLLGYSGSAQNVVLPSDINSVGIDAFKGSSVVKSIEVPYNVSKIYSGAFANCSNLERVIIPFTVTDISSTAFTGTDATVYCYYNSYAYNYAVANNIKYELITVTLSTNSVNIVETEAVTVNAVPSVTLASGVPLVWKSANPAVASVDSTGKIVGNTAGNTTVGIYALDGNKLDECSVTVGEKAEIKLEDVSTDTLKYGEKIVLHVNSANLPECSSVKWTATNGNILKTSNENAACSKHENCTTCTVESVGNGSAEIKATVVDKDGNQIIQNGEEISTSYKMKSKAGFFQKIIAFFKKLFGLLKTYPQTL